MRTESATHLPRSATWATSRTGSQNGEDGRDGTDAVMATCSYIVQRSNSHLMGGNRYKTVALRRIFGTGVTNGVYSVMAVFYVPLTSFVDAVFGRGTSILYLGAFVIVQMLYLLYILDYLFKFGSERDYLEAKTGWRPGRIYYLGIVPVLGVFVVARFLSKRNERVESLGGDVSGPDPGPTGSERRDSCDRCGASLGDEPKICTECGVLVGGTRVGSMVAYLVGGFYLVAAVSSVLDSTGELTVAGLAVDAGVALVGVGILPPVQRTLRRSGYELTRWRVIAIVVVATIALGSVESVLA